MIPAQLIVSAATHETLTAVIDIKTYLQLNEGFDVYLQCALSDDLEDFDPEDEDDEDEDDFFDDEDFDDEFDDEELDDEDELEDLEEEA